MWLQNIPEGEYTLKNYKKNYNTNNLIIRNMTGIYARVSVDVCVHVVLAYNEKCTKNRKCV